MFQLSQTHNQAFQENAIKYSREKIINAVKESFPELIKYHSEAELKRLCSFWIEVGSRYSLFKEKTIYAIFVATLFVRVTPDNFETTDWLKNHLNSSNISEGSKGYILVQVVINHLENREVKNG